MYLSPGTNEVSVFWCMMQFKYDVMSCDLLVVLTLTTMWFGGI